MKNCANNSNCKDDTIKAAPAIFSDSGCKTYRIQGLSCTSCASTFEDNVKKLAGVEDAKINFGASKITIKGDASIQDIEKAGAFDKLKIVDDNNKIIAQVPFWKQKENFKVYLSAIILALSWLLSVKMSENHLAVTLGYASAILIGGFSLFVNGFKNLSRFKFDINTLMTIAIIGAAIIGQWGEGAMVVILFAISEALERYSVDKARQSIKSLMDIAPKQALIRRNHNEMTVDVNKVAIGDIMIVKPGEKLAMDGVIIKGHSSLNQATITGESVPVNKTVNDEVYAGTLNQEGLIEVKVTKRVEDTTLAKIIKLVEEAQDERAPSQAFVDKFAQYYTPFIIILALLIGIVPPLFFSADWSNWIYQGLAVLVVGCPCALVISTPVAVVTAIGNAAKQGVLIKGGIYLEQAGELKAIAFDKTGTLTKGKPIVTSLVSFDKNDHQTSNVKTSPVAKYSTTSDKNFNNEYLAIAAALEYGSEHPLASAIINKAEENHLNYKDYKVSNFKSITGKGIKAIVNNHQYYVGSPTLLKNIIGSIDAHQQQNINQLQNQGKTVMVLGDDNKILALIGVADEVRASSKQVINKLNDDGIKTIMLTGDNDLTASEICKQVGLSETKANLLPEDKLKVIKCLLEDYKSVAMVGDGINDAPALAAATVGVAMGVAGTDIALETADIALMSDDLTQLPYTITLSRKAIRVIKQNIGFALGLKVLALLLVIPGWLTLWIAIFADMGATLIVTLNSLRLLSVKKKGGKL